MGEKNERWVSKETRIPRRILVPIALFASLSRRGLGTAKRSEKSGGDEGDSVGEEVKH